MARATVSVTARIPIADLDDMRRNLQWARDLLPRTAVEELAKEQARGNLRDETAFVDGRQSPDVFSVKPFGRIVYVAGVGPLDAAIRAADAFARAVAPRESGALQGGLRWFANGRPRGGAPAAATIGRRGNAELVSLVPYAAMAEIFVPRGVIFATYNHLARMFGSQLAIGFRYADAKDFGDHVRPGARRDLASGYFKVPVLSIGNPASTVRPGVMRSRPGYNLQHRRRAVRRYLRAKGVIGHG